MSTLQHTISVILFTAITVTAQQPQLPATTGGKVIQGAQVTDAVARTNMLAKTGGIVAMPDAGPSIAVVNMQAQVSGAALTEAVESIKKIVRLPLVQLEKTGKDARAVASETLKDAKVAGVVVVCDVAAQPTLLLAPDERWALLNVAGLKTPGASEEVVAERTHKELWRAMGFLVGTGYSAFQGCLMRPMQKPADLDAVKAKNLSPEGLQKLLRNSALLGLRTPRFTTYRKACEEGWAPMPTNNFQKAIWEEVKAKK